jgi:hypothetical protein
MCYVHEIQYINVTPYKTTLLLCVRLVPHLVGCDVYVTSAYGTRSAGVTLSAYTLRTVCYHTYERLYLAQDFSLHTGG